MTAYYLNFFKTRGFDFLKLDFLTHGALEGVHFDTNVMTGIQAYNQGMQYLLTQNNGRMFLSAAISPIFPYQYAHSRRIYCDAATLIGDTAGTMQAVSYGWWINSRLYQYSDPDMMKFSGGTANENQSRLINCAVAGTVFLNSDDLASTTGQDLARTYLTNADINEVARAGVSFRPVEGNTGTNAAEIFVRQDGSTWHVAVFNYTASGINKGVNLARLGLSGTYNAVDLWSGTLSMASGANWNVALGARQARLFRLSLTMLTPVNLTATLDAGKLALNWPADHTGWRLQTQTNTLTANWWDVNGSRQTNVWTVPINPAGQSVFFRLAWP